MTQPVDDINHLIGQMAENLKSRFSDFPIENTLLVGIHTGGVWVGERLHQALGIKAPMGQLDISFYRDDFSRIGINPQVRPSSLPMDMDDRRIILVDDVLYTGRTIRAALNEIFDYGRPASVTLAVLCERDGRELPVQADVVGQHFDLSARQHIQLSGPDPLRLEIVEAS